MIPKRPFWKYPFLQEAKVAVVYGADATGSNFSHLPKGLFYAGYTTGSGGVAWTPVQFSAHPSAIRICQDPGATDLTADVLDVESSAATLLDCAPWARAALANFRKATRPGQRSPAIYCSQSSVTNVVNALTAGKVTGIGLFIANWNLTKEQATADLAKSAGPYPVIGYQYADAGLYDLDVWLTSWVNAVSEKGDPPVNAEVPPGQWLDAATWTWDNCVLIGKGMDDQLHVFNFDPTTGKWSKAE
jgi:hypothetical protein